MFTVTITALTALIPYFISHSSRLKNRRAPSWLPLLAAALFFLAFFTPDIHISKETSTFQQHFIGGGVYCACLYLYFQKLFAWRFNFAISFILLFAWTSAFGVANELLEFMLTKLKLANIDTGDTDWDLVANTTGAIIGYMVLTFNKILRRE